MSGVHIVGPAGGRESLLRQWAANGLQAVTHVKPEPGDSARLRSILPNGTLVGRLASADTLSDSAVQQRYEADPRGAAEWLWNAHYAPVIAANPHYTCWQFNNEPVFGDGAATRQHRIRMLCEFTHRIVDIANARGHGVALFNFARGTPEPDEWHHFYEVWRYALSRNAGLPAGRKNVLSIHQYGSFGARGHGSLFHEERWHIKRYETVVRPTLSADLRRAEYLITESGPDGGSRELGGWRQVYGESDEGRVALLDDWRRYNEWLAQQPGCLGACYFTLGQEGGFHSFDVSSDALANAMAHVHYPRLKPAESVPPSQPQPTPTPQGGGGTMSLTDRLAAALKAEFGSAFEDLRGKLPQTTRVDANGKPIRYATIDSRGFDYIAIHHSETPKNRSWENIAAYHVNTNKWAGIGYHMGIRQGKVALFDSVDTERAHVYGMNHEAIGVCVTGNYDTTPLDAQDESALKRLIRVLDAVYGHQKKIAGHGEIRVGGYTACPGSDLKRVLPKLRTAVPVPAPTPEWSEVDREKAEWFVAQMARALRGDESAAAALFGAIAVEPKRVGLHNVLVAKALPPLKKGAA